MYAVATFQWFFWVSLPLHNEIAGVLTLFLYRLQGYSLAFGNGSKFIGNLQHFGLMNVDAQPSGVLPSIVFAIYQ